MEDGKPMFHPPAHHTYFFLSARGKMRGEGGEDGGDVAMAYPATAVFADHGIGFANRWNIKARPAKMTGARDNVSTAMLAKPLDHGQAAESRNGLVFSNYAVAKHD